MLVGQRSQPVENLLAVGAGQPAGAGQQLLRLLADFGVLVLGQPPLDFDRQARERDRVVPERGQSARVQSGRRSSTAAALSCAAGVSCPNWLTIASPTSGADNCPRASSTPSANSGVLRGVSWATIFLMSSALACELTRL